METLQLAQMLADLSNLNATDPHTTDSLFDSNKTTAQRPSDAIISTSVPTAPQPHNSTPAPQSIQLRDSLTTAPEQISASWPSSPPPITRTTGNPTSFDSYISRHLLSTPIPSSSSLPGTPHGETDTDIDRASALLALYELRAKLKQYNDNNSLQLAREKIFTLSTQRQKQQNTYQPSKGTAPSTPVLQPPSLGRQYTQYTHPHISSKLPQSPPHR